MIKHLNPYKTALSLLMTFILTGPGLADWREDMGRFRIGFLATGQIEKAVLDAEPFRLAVEEKLGIPVELLPLRDLAGIAQSHTEGRLEYAIYPSTTYAAVWVNCECIEPLAVTRAFDGTAKYHAILLGRTGGSVSKPSDLHGKSIWSLSKEDSVARQLAISSLANRGIDLLNDNTTFLSADTPREVLTRFVAGEGDLLLGWSSLHGDPAKGYSRGTLKLLAELSGSNPAGYPIIWSSSPIPHRIHAIRKSLDRKPKQLLGDLLMSLHDEDPIAYDAIEPVMGGGFQALSDLDIAGMLAFVRAIGGNSGSNAPGENRTTNDAQSKSEASAPISQ